MGAGKQKKEIERNAADQRGIAQRQGEVGEEQLGIGREQLDRQRSIYDMIEPYIGQMLSLFDPNDEGYAARPDISAQIKRDYMDDLAGIEQGKNRNVADFEDYATAGGLSRSGMRGGGLGAIVRGAQDETGTARRNYQQRLTDESLARIEDARRVAGMKTGVAVAGANIAQGQQANFNPTPYFSMGSSNIGGGAGTLSQSSEGYYRSGSLPSKWSTAGGIVGQGLGMAGQAASGGTGLRNIWSGGR